jgi:membrane protein
LRSAAKFSRIFSRSIADFFRDGGIMLAGAISYFSMMALVPLCLFLIAIFGYILGHYHGFYEFLVKKLTHFFPDITSGIVKEFGKLMTYKGLGAFSVVLYGFLSLQVFSSVESALNRIFKTKQRRTFLWSFILSLIIITFLISMLLISFIATSMVPLLLNMRDLFPNLRIGMITVFLIRYVIPFFMVLFSITVMYIFFPKARIKMSHALAGALFATVFLEIAKHVFTWYVGTVINFGAIYGPLTAFVLFLLWMFYSSCIFLIGAEIVYNLSAEHKRG